MARNRTLTVQYTAVAIYGTVGIPRRHGRRISKVPSLRGPEGLVHTHGEISDILSHRFFTDAPPQVPPHFHDDPPPCPTRTLHPVDQEMIAQLLSKTNSRSAPGRSGHMWTIIKWAWAVDPE